MSALYRTSINAFLNSSNESILGLLTQQSPGSTPEQHRAWSEQNIVLRNTFPKLIEENDSAQDWGLLLEYRMFRLHRRIDAVLLAGNVIFVIEFKMGSDRYESADIHQAEDYALDLRDFHAGSLDYILVPLLCASEAGEKASDYLTIDDNVTNVQFANRHDLANVILRTLRQLPASSKSTLVMEAWDKAAYSPVPNIIEAAELMYAAHDVEEIHSALANQQNLTATSDRLIEIIYQAKLQRQHAICFVTGVPGSGKTLTGLNAVHDPRFRDVGGASGAFLSGNTPLVEVLREALAQDHRKREGGTIKDARRKTKAEIQLLMRYLEEYETRDENRPPHEHVIVFDEAQRAWDAAYGKQKFGREASEPTLFFEIMSRHQDWTVIIALVGGGQEINKGEGGLPEWGQALASFHAQEISKPWHVYASPHVLQGSAVTAGGVLFPEGAPSGIPITQDEVLHLPVSIRSHRCEMANAWIDAVLDGNAQQARAITEQLDDFPIYITRSLDEMRDWLNTTTRGHRRCGLVASSNARRLRAYGLGVTLSTQDLDGIKNWFLMPRGDVRSSYQLEVTATEYACQGLELDRVGLCWGGDMTWSNTTNAWEYRAFRGKAWQKTNKPEARLNTKNTYRVLMSRAREAMVIWIPEGNDSDPTRPVEWMEETADYLLRCGVIGL